MATHNSIFKMNTKNLVFVKPPNLTLSSILSLSAIDNRPDLDIITDIVYVYQSKNHDSLFTQIDPALVIKEALSKALLYYYPLAGRLVKQNGGNFQIHFNAIDCGVPFLEADADCHLSSLHYLDGNNVEFAKHLVYHPPLEGNNDHHYPLMIKVTKFLCGGFTIGLAMSHHLCDGYGISQFYKAMIEVAKGNNEPSMKPVWERERLAGSAAKLPFQGLGDVASMGNSPLWPSTKITHECFKVEHESIRRLKMRLVKESGNESMEEKSFTTFEALGACVWRSRARALQLNNEGNTILNFPMGMRGHLDPPLPDGYYGNALLDADVALTVKELNERPLVEVMNVIRDTKKATLTTDSIKRAIDTIYPALECDDTVGPWLMILNDWRHLGLMENTDFGGYKLVNMVPIAPSPCEEENIFSCLIAPPSKLEPSVKGGVRLFLSLPAPAMIKFRQEMEDLEIIKPFGGMYETAT